MTTEVIRSYKGIADELGPLIGKVLCDRTIRRYVRRRTEHNPLVIYSEIGGEVAILREELRAWAARERIRLGCPEVSARVRPCPLVSPRREGL